MKPASGKKKKRVKKKVDPILSDGRDIRVLPVAYTFTVIHIFIVQSGASGQTRIVFQLCLPNRKFYIFLTFLNEVGVLDVFGFRNAGEVGRFQKLGNGDGKVS